MTIFNVFNQYSFVASALAGGLLVALLAWRWRSVPAVLRGGLVLAYVGLVIAARLALNYTPNFDGSLQAVEDTLGNGQPTVLMLYSNY